MNTSEEIYKSFAIGSIIAGLALPFSIASRIFNALNGLKYIDTGMPPGYYRKTNNIDAILVIIPFAAFFLAGLYIGKKLGRSGFRYGFIFSLLWTFVLLGLSIAADLYTYRGMQKTFPNINLYNFFYTYMFTLPAIIGGFIGGFNKSVKN